MPSALREPFVETRSMIYRILIDRDDFENVLDALIAISGGITTEIRRMQVEAQERRRLQGASSHALAAVMDKCGVRRPERACL